MSQLPIWQGGNAFEPVGQVAASSLGTAVTTGNAVKGAWAQLIASTAFGYVGLIVSIKLASTVAYAIDLGIGAGGSEVVVVPDLAGVSRELTQHFFLPIAIPAGSRIAARGADAGGGGLTATVQLQGIAGVPTLPPGFERATSYGANGVGSGTAVDAGAVVNTKGAYVQLAASSTNPIKQLYVLVQSNTPVVAADMLFDIAVGAAASEVVLCSGGFRGSNGSAYHYVLGPYPVSVPAGTRLSARVQSSDVTDANSRSPLLSLLALD